MAYLPDFAPTPPIRHAAGPLWRWVSFALAERLEPLELEAALLRLEHLYFKRRAECRTFQPVPDLATETAWLLGVLEAEDFVTGVARVAVTARVRHHLQDWESGD